MANRSGMLHDTSHVVLLLNFLQVNGTRADPQHLAAQGGLDLSVSCKVSPLPGQEGQVIYERYPQIIPEIIRNTS